MPPLRTLAVQVSPDLQPLDFTAAEIIAASTKQPRLRGVRGKEGEPPKGSKPSETPPRGRVEPPMPPADTPPVVEAAADTATAGKEPPDAEAAAGKGGASQGQPRAAPPLRSDRKPIPPRTGQPPRYEAALIAEALIAL